MIVDAHVHADGSVVDVPQLEKRLDASGVDEVMVLSAAPRSMSRMWAPGMEFTNEQRLEHLIATCSQSHRLHPVYWIDPTEDDAEAQVNLAAEKGAVGFKVICSTHYPGDPRAMKAYYQMAKLNKSVLFHSGILWDGKSSSKYNRPAEFEDLIEVAGLKFAIAHVSWPWTDECIAVFGKYQNAVWNYGRQDIAKMYIDLTPGTPLIYREEVLYRLLKTGYDVADSIFFGTDEMLETYRPEQAKLFMNFDRSVYAKLAIPADVQDRIFGGNVKEFFGI